MTWLAAVQDIPGGGLETPDLPPGVWKLAAFAALFGAARLLWMTGVLDPVRLLDWLHNLVPTNRLRRNAYGVATRVFSMEPIYGNTKDRSTRRAIRAAHAKQTVPDLNRSGGYTAYAKVVYKAGVDTGPGSKLRLAFESVWRQEMTRPDKHGNAAHDWEFKWYIGSPVVVCRIAPLPAAEVVRLFDHLNGTPFKWPDGTRPVEVIDHQIGGPLDPIEQAVSYGERRGHDEHDQQAQMEHSYLVDVPRGSFKYGSAEQRLSVQRHVNATISSPTGAWKHDWSPTEDRYTIRTVPPLPERVAWQQADLRIWGEHPDPALPVGVTHGRERIWWEYEREGQIHGGIFGQTGAGKSGSAQSIVVAALLSGFEKVIVLDPKAGPDWAWLANYPRVEFAYSLEHIAEVLAGADRLREKRSARQLKAVAAHEEPPPFAPILIFVDEASALFTRQRAGEASKGADFLRSLCAARTNNIAKMGRSANMHLLIGTQRPRADSVDSDTKAQIGFRIGLGDLDSIAARMIFDTSEAATDRDLGEILDRVTTAGRGFAGTVGGSLADVQLFYRTRKDLIALLGPPPAPAPVPEPPEQVFGSQVEEIVVPSVREPLTDWG